MVSDKPVERIGLRHLIVSRFAMAGVREASRPEDLQAGLLPADSEMIIFELPLRRVAKLRVLEAVRRVRRVRRSLPIVLMGDERRRMCLGPASEAGAMVWMDKAATREECLALIERLLWGGESVPAAMSCGLIEPFPGTSAGDSGTEFLSRREYEVMQLLVEGLSQGEVAQRLEISPKTVNVHKTRLFAKLNVASVAELILLVLRYDPRTQPTHPALVVRQVA